MATFHVHYVTFVETNFNFYIYYHINWRIQAVGSTNGYDARRTSEFHHDGCLLYLSNWFYGPYGWLCQFNCSLVWDDYRIGYDYGVNW